MDTGAASVSGFVALYAIYDPTTQTAALLATKQGNVYGGANMLSGYTASGLVGVWPTNGSGQFAIGYQADRTISFPYVTLLTTTTSQASITSLSIANAVPLNAKTVTGLLSMTSSTTSQTAIDVAGASSGIGQQNLNMTITSSSLWGGQVIFKDIPLITAQTIYYIATTSAGSPNDGLYASVYTF